jgi:hypothetical protein
MMDLRKTILELNEQKEKLESVIALLEELQSTSPPAVPQTGKGRGRKSMSAEERAEVSARMKKYWAVRRKDTR